MKIRRSYPQDISIIAGIFIITILCIALVNLYVSVELRQQYLQDDRDKIISIIGLCVDTWNSSNTGDPAAMHARLRRITWLFGIDQLIITDTLGNELYNSLTLPFTIGFEPANNARFFKRAAKPDELLQFGEHLMYYNTQPACLVYLQYNSAYTVIDRAFKWHILFITVLLIFMAFLGIFLVRNLLLPMRYVARTAREFGIEMKREDFVSETFQEVFNKIRSRERTLVEFSAYIAHEFRNSLATITGLSRLVEKGKRKADDIIRECRSMDDLISAILEFSRPVKPILTACDAAKLIREAVERVAVPSRITVEQRVPRPLSLRADCDLLAVAVANLVKNSVEAIEGEGRIIVTASYEGEGDPYLKLQVEDTGRGIDRADMEQVFSPFFSKKESGVGLGLAYVKKIVEIHEGRIEVMSGPGKGAKFIITLPREPRGSSSDETTRP
ncbi:MAG TPA: HAMP domain-containing sensor histidine kinase [bacterium]